MNAGMNPHLPIDKQEGEKLELKSLAALDEPDNIAREAVGMLNSQGGEVWIGIEEGEERHAVEPLPRVEAARQRRRLQDHLLDVIEPTPVAGEVSVTEEPVGSGPQEEGRVLRVALMPAPGRRPYALRRHSGRHFLRRFGDRIVPMSWDEIGRAFKAAEPLATPRAAHQLLEDLEILREGATDRLWLGIEPQGPGELNLRGLAEMPLLEDPTLSRTPRGSYNFTAALYRGAARIVKSELMIGDDELSLRILKSGGVRFEAALAETFWVGRVPFVEAERLLSPEALLGYLLSVVRLVGRLLEAEAPLWRRSPQGDLWVALGITGLRGWGLLPGNLAEWPSYRYQIRRFQDQDLILREPLRFTQDDIRDRPDECGVRIVERIYDAFEIDRLPSITATALGHAGLPAIERGGYSRPVSLDLGDGARNVARLRQDPHQPGRSEWETRDGDRIPASGRWVHGWSYVE